LAASAATIYSNGSGCISIQYSYLPTELSGGGLPPVPYNITVDGGSGCR